MPTVGDTRDSFSITCEHRQGVVASAHEKVGQARVLCRLGANSGP